MRVPVHELKTEPVFQRLGVARLEAYNIMGADSLKLEQELSYSTMRG
ncbi:hypothetical protein L195_g061955 [Trifolium pratense]|uniref:Uncharacterized protein n=1 Tax=Trifolium pratense TaxID=57577 RepID=A0A2K3KCT8_TRIPR|nr:hypothetical protein L195_g061955 [Trifolium pratense]